MVAMRGWVSERAERQISGAQQWRRADFRKKTMVAEWGKEITPLLFI
jgi:hypothetical protein